MMLINRHPMATYGIRRDISDIWDGLLRQDQAGASRRFRAYPQFNIWEEDDALQVEAEVPGVKLEDIEILVEGQELTIQSSGECCQADANRRYIHRERPEGQFSRTITLPYEVNMESVEAILNQGILSIVLPKAESLKPRRIAVTAQS